jgi:hypothetical protein
MLGVSFGNLEYVLGKWPKRERMVDCNLMVLLSIEKGLQRLAEISHQGDEASGCLVSHS